MLEGSELSRRGHDLLFLSPRGRLLTGMLQERGFPVWSPCTFGKIDPVTPLRVARLVRSGHFQLVQTHLSTASLLGSLSARLAGVPSIATVHGMNSAFCYRFSTVVITVSDAVRRYLIAQGLPDRKIRVVHNGIDTSRFVGLPCREEARAALGIDPNEQVILYAGRFSPEKGVRLLPAILQRLNQGPGSVRLLLLGEGALKDELLKGFRECGVENQVQATGFQRDTRPFLAAADLVIMPSYKEGLPRSLMEAMAARLPAVAAAAGGIPEVLESGVTGEIRSIGDVEGMAQACKEILSNPAQRDRMGSAAYRRVHEHFSIQQSVSGLEAVFEEVLGVRNARVQTNSVSP